MTLEERIRDAVKQRKLVALNLWPTPGGEWQGNVSADRVSWRIGLDDDPVRAIEKALGAAPAPSIEDMLS